MLKLTSTVITLNVWKTITRMSMRVTIQMKGMELGARINTTKKMMIMSKILSITPMKPSFAINRCKKRRMKVRNKQGKPLERRWRGRRRTRSRGGRAGPLRRTMMMRNSPLLKKLRKRRKMEVTQKNSKMRKMS
jgi:hypothetical protein